MKSLLEKYSDTNEDSQSAIVLYGLHHLLYIRNKCGTILDSIKTMIYITEETNVNVIIEQQRNILAAKKMSLQPFILVISADVTNLSTSQFLLVFDNIKYVFPSLLKALDSLLKVYLTFDLEYPKANSLVFSLIERFFFGIQPKISSPKLNALIKKLNE